MVAPRPDKLASLPPVIIWWLNGSVGTALLAPWLIPGVACGGDGKGAMQVLVIGPIVSPNNTSQPVVSVYPLPRSQLPVHPVKLPSEKSALVHCACRLLLYKKREENKAH